MDKFLKKTIKPLSDLMSSFKMTPDDWCITGEYAWVIQGYNVLLRDNHIDMYVKESKLPWPVRDRIQTIPPAGSKELEIYSHFVKEHKTALHMVPLPKPGNTEHLIDNFANKINVNGTYVNVISLVGWLTDFELMMRAYEIPEFGEERLDRWKKFLDRIYAISIEKNDGFISKKTKALSDKYFNSC